MNSIGGLIFAQPAGLSDPTASKSLIEQQRQQLASSSQTQTDKGDTVTLSSYAGTLLSQSTSQSAAGTSNYVDAAAYYTTIRQLSQSLTIDSRAVSSQALSQQANDGTGLTQLASTARKEHLSLSFDLEVLKPNVDNSLNVQLLSSTALSGGTLSFGLGINGNTLELGQVQLTSGDISFTTGSARRGSAPAQASGSNAATSTLSLSASTLQVSRQTNLDLSLDAQGNITTDASAAVYALHLHLDEQETSAQASLSSDQASQFISAQASLDITDGTPTLHAVASAVQLSHSDVVETRVSASSPDDSQNNGAGKSFLPKLYTPVAELISLTYLKAQYQQTARDMQNVLLA